MRRQPINSLHQSEKSRQTPAESKENLTPKYKYTIKNKELKLKQTIQKGFSSPAKRGTHHQNIFYTLYLTLFTGLFYITHESLSQAQDLVGMPKSIILIFPRLLASSRVSLKLTSSLSPFLYLVSNVVSNITSYESRLKALAPFSNSKSYELAEYYFNKGDLEQATMHYKQITNTDSHYQLAQLNITLIENINNIFDFMSNKINLIDAHHSDIAKLLALRLDNGSLYDLAVQFRKLAKHQNTKATYQFAYDLFVAVNKPQNGFNDILSRNSVGENEMYCKAQYNGGRCLYELYRLHKDAELLSRAHKHFSIASEWSTLTELADNCIKMIEVDIKKLAHATMPIDETQLGIDSTRWLGKVGVVGFSVILLSNLYNLANAEDTLNSRSLSASIATANSLLVSLCLVFDPAHRAVSITRERGIFAASNLISSIDYFIMPSAFLKSSLGLFSCLAVRSVVDVANYYFRG